MASPTPSTFHSLPLTLPNSFIEMLPMDGDGEVARKWFVGYLARKVIRADNERKEAEYHNLGAKEMERILGASPAATATQRGNSTTPRMATSGRRPTMETEANGFAISPWATRAFTADHSAWIADSPCGA